MKIDCHIHTFCSVCSSLSLDDLEKKCLERGINAIIIVDHNEIKCAQSAQEKFKQVKIIVGEEITTTEGEVVGLFLTKRIPPKISLGEAMDLIHAQDGLVCVPHPFDRSTGRRKALSYDDCLKFKDKIDLVEVFNSRTLLGYYNRKALEFAKKFNKPMLVGSDAHTKWEIGNAYVEIDEFRSQQEFLNNLKGAKFTKRRTYLFNFLITFFVRLRKNIED